ALIKYDQADVASVTVNGGLNADIFTVNNTPTNFNPAGLVTTLNTGGGNDTVHVLGTAGPLAGPVGLVVNGQDGDDLVQAGRVLTLLNNILAPVTVNGGANSGLGDTVTLFDTGDVVGRVFTITDTTVTRSNAPNPVTVNYAAVESLNVQSGNGADACNVVSTA